MDRLCSTFTKFVPPNTYLIAKNGLIMIHVRPAATEDIPLIQNLAQRTWPHTFRDIISPEQIAYMLNWMYSTEALTDQIRQGNNFLLAIAEDESLGYLSYELDNDDRQLAKLHKIYVLPQTQGKGVGKMLIDQAVELVRENGRKELILNVNKHNSAIKFYEKLGFAFLRYEVNDIGNGFVMDDIVMSKKLLELDFRLAPAHSGRIENLRLGR